MLEIIDIKKDYVMKDETVNALKGVSLCFRRKEFVSILGPSGCGKTTLLNIIGGLDRYTNGDLIIDGVSTKKFKDKDWDNYRNHRVGFVFQNYNLIPHQTVLENVELALTLSGIKKKDRRARAIEVLTRVGLGDKLKSKPNQLSGGQMQRVAIARALVNDPEIILADEPTGALDSKTSVQIMELLKEVSKDKLVIMVTHNPTLAEQYSTRIVRLLDGELIEDTKPYSKKALDKEVKKYLDKKQENITFKKTEKKKSMSLFTALGLSFKNLLTKKGRTSIVALAGSIGIIGIALILAVSAGMTGYIDNMQSESFSSYPVAISSLSVDMNNALEIIGKSNNEQTKDDESLSVYSTTKIITQMGKYNYISSEFISYVKDKVENEKDKLNDFIISYASDMRLITQFDDNGTEIYMPINSKTQSSAMSGTTSSLFFESLNNKDYILSLYDIKGGENAHYPENKNEVALVINQSSISTEELSRLGIEYKVNQTGDFEPIQYEDLIGKKHYKLLLNDAYFDADTMGYKYFNFNDFKLPEQYKNEETQQKLETLFNDDNTIDLTISCVLTLKENASGSIFDDGIMYTTELGKTIHTNSVNSAVAEKVRETFLDSDKNFIDSQTPYTIPYTLNFLEAEAYLQGYDSLFIYSSPKQMQEMLKNPPLSIDLNDEQIIEIYLQTYGASSIPTGVYFYVSSFDGKDFVNQMISDYNSLETTTYKINYSDTSALLSNMLGSLVDIISYVLIAFASISLVVSSIMISIITYTSVIERTKEIGVLRSVGASKKDISRVFNAETIIIGLLAGLFGIGISLIIALPIGLILTNLTGVSGLVVVEPLSSILLIVISVVLTFIAGLIPARIASKKDPVKALRAE